MTFSMTAFSRNETNQVQRLITIELRSVNHRYLDLTIRTPDELRMLEHKMRNILSSQISRGKVELNIRLQQDASSTINNDIQLNEKLIGQLATASKTITSLVQNVEKMNPLDILRWPGVIQSEEVDSNVLQQAVLDCLHKSIDEFLETRKREGDKLSAMIIERCNAIQDIVSHVEEIIPKVLSARKEKIINRIAEFDFDQDDKRIEQEVVLLAQKMDVTEETDRLTAHITEVRNVLKQNKPIGRRLDFLMQELNREANTLGSKSIDTETTRASVDLKVLIEQMREQIQNIE